MGNPFIEASVKPDFDDRFVVPGTGSGGRDDAARIDFSAVLRELQTGDASVGSRPSWMSTILKVSEPSRMPPASRSIIDALGASEGVAVYLPQGAMVDTLPQDLDDRTTLTALKQYLELGIPIDVVHVNVGSLQGGFYDGADERIDAVRALLDEHGYHDAEVSAWIETAVTQSPTSPSRTDNADSLYGGAFLDVTDPAYIRYYKDAIDDLVANPNVRQINLDDQSWGLIAPSLWLDENPGVSPEEMTELVTSGFIEVIQAVKEGGKDAFYSANGPFAASRITKQGIDVYGLIEGGLDHVEVQGYRNTVEGFAQFLDEVRADLDARPDTIAKLTSFHIALSQQANGEELPPETRATQIAMANEFLAQVKEDFGLEKVGVSLWPQAYNNYVTGESIRHPDDPS